MRRGACLVLLALACGEHPAPTTPPGSRSQETPANRPPPPRLRLSGEVRPIRVQLELTIVPDRPEFGGRVAIAAEVTRPLDRVWLNATDLVISSASLGGQAAVVTKADDDFIALSTGKLLQPGPLAITVEYSGTIDRTRSRGIYAEREGDEWYAYTFFEALDARRAFPGFDQPDAKVPWQLTFRVRKDHVALANAPVVSESIDPDGMKKVVMAESKPMPSYLVAFVVGPFDVVDGGTGGRAATRIRFVVPRGRGAELRYAREVTPKVVAALEDYFDMDYPYVKLDVAVVPRYWGTMEHPGLVAMGQPLTLIPPGEETRGRKEHYASILAHELAHYWFGDLVTMAWWDDTWLNEALGTWMDAIITDKAEPSWRHLDSRVERAVDAMSADEKLSTRAIRQPVASKEQIESSFDASITYYKGQSVLLMFETWVGADRWRDFIRAYLNEHAWKNATTDDFLAGMKARLGAQVARAFRTFLDQPGAPLIEHRLVCQGQPRVELSQKRALPAGAVENRARTWRLPVCARYGAGKQSHRSCVLLEAAQGVMPLEGGCPGWLLMNAGGVGYYRSRYSVEEAAALLSRRSLARLTPVERRLLLSDIDAAVGRDQLSIADAMAMVPDVLADPDERIQRAAWGLTSALRPDLFDDDLHARYQRWTLTTLGRLARTLGWRRRPRDSDERQDLRRFVVSVAALAGDRKLRAEAGKLTRAWLASPSAVEDDMVDAILEVAARDGDAELFDRILAAARAEKDRNRQRRLVTALGGFEDPALVARALDLVLGVEFDLRESRDLLARSAGMRRTQAQAWKFIQEHVDQLLARMRSDEASWFVGGTGLFCDATRRGEVEALFRERAARIDGARYALDQALEQIDQCIRAQARLAPSAASFLARY